MENIDKSRGSFLLKMHWRILLICCALLITMLVPLVVLIVMEKSLVALMLAFAVCFLTAVLAHVFSEIPPGDEFLLARFGLSSLVRTGPPMVLVFIVKKVSEPTFEGGLIYYIVLFYLVGLSVDVVLNYWRLNPSFSDLSKEK